LTASFGNLNIPESVVCVKPPLVSELHMTITRAVCTHPLHFKQVLFFWQELAIFPCGSSYSCHHHHPWGCIWWKRSKVPSGDTDAIS
jgi:hypothetical protein